MNYIMKAKFPHYYGDTVRWLFMIAAIGMLLMLPAVSNILNIPAVVSVIGILILGFAAGFTNPKQLWDAVVNAIISAGGFLMFETVAVWTYQQNFNTAQAERFFLANVGLGLVFLIAIYFSVKTLRGLLLSEDNHEPITKE